MELKRLVHQLISVTVVHRYLVTKAALSAGLYIGQPNMLQYIKNNDKCTQKELAKAIYISAPSAATSLKRMEKAGLITRIPDEKDPRKNHISITEKGINALDDFTINCNATDEKMFKGFTEDEKNTLYELLCRLHENLDSKNLPEEDICKLFKNPKGEQNES